MKGGRWYGRESDKAGKCRLPRHAAHPALRVAYVCIDDGFTGTNFDRPSFCRIIEDIKAGRIDFILVGDISRFGRDYIEAGRNLERWLTAHGVRFLALGDGIGSERGAYDMMLPLKNQFNAQYAKDVSEKVKTAMHTKRRREGQRARAE